MAFRVGDYMIETLWVRMKWKTNKVNVVVGVYYQPHSQDDDSDELFYKELRDICRSTALVLMSDFNFPDITWKSHTVDTKRSRKSLKHAKDYFLVQVLREPPRKAALLDLFVNREVLMGKMVIGGCLGHSDHEVAEFQMAGDRRKTARKL